MNFAGSYVQSTFDDDVIDTTFGRLCETNGASVCTFLPRTPRSKASLGLEYTMPVAAYELSVRGDLNWQSKYYVENLTDELYASSAFAVSVINQYGPALGNARTAGITVRYNF